MKIEYTLSDGYDRFDMNDPLNQIELNSLRAIIALAAKEQDKSEETIRNIVAANFNVAQIEDLRRGAYTDVTKFLVDTQIDMILN